MKPTRIIIRVLAIVNLVPLFAFAIFSLPRTAPPEGVQLAFFYYWPNSQVLLGLLTLELALITTLITQRRKAKKEKLHAG